MFFQVRDAIKYGIIVFLFISLPGKAQTVPDSVSIHLPDTLLNIENTLFFIEKMTVVYFSYNPGIFDMDRMLEWEKGTYPLPEVLERIIDDRELEFTEIGNQVVFYRKGEEPDLAEIADRSAPEPLIRRIRGRILSQASEEPLAYATVWLPSTWEGTISNAEGYFLLKISGTTGNDTLSVSSMGYKNRSIPLSELKDSLNIIRLNTSFIPIQEVVIRRSDPLFLIRQAIENIPRNYSRDPVVQTAFYRETIRKNNKYVEISEAVLDVYKPGYESVSGEQVRVLRGRKNNDFSEMDTLVVKLKAGLETSFLLDLIRNRPDFLKEDQFHRFTYRMSDIVVIQDKSTYAIDFVQNENTDPPHFRGRIYIDLESLAFRGLEFEVDPRTLSSIANSMILKKPRKVRVRPLSAHYVARYKSEGELFYLSLIRAENRFRVRMHKKLFGDEFRVVSEMAVTGLKTGDVKRFPYRETANARDIFADMLGGYDPDFWGPYNYLIPEESLEEALIRIGRLMEKDTSATPTTGNPPSD